MVICQFVKSMQIQIQSIALGAKPAENVSLKVKVFFENASCKLSNFHKIPVQSIFQKFQITDYKMKAKEMLHHLQAISKEETSCTLITNLGERVEVKYPAETNFEKLNRKFSRKICHRYILYIFRSNFHLQYFQVQSFLLAAISPFLASLLSQVLPENTFAFSQAGSSFPLFAFFPRLIPSTFPQAGNFPCISLPCSSSLLSSFITSLVNGQAFGEEQQQLASLLGINKQIWKSETKPKTPGGEQGFQIDFVKKKKVEPQHVSTLGIESKTDKCGKIPKQLREGFGLKVEEGLANEVKVNKVILGSQPTTMHRIRKENIKYESLAKEGKKMLVDESFIFDTAENSPATTKHKIPEVVTVESSNKNIVLKGLNIKDENSKPTLDSFLCEICSKTFANKHILKIHAKLHDEKTDICDVCSKAFSNKHVLKAHISTHKQEKTQCQTCFEFVFGLKNHMKNKHEEKKLVACSNCGVEVKGISRHERFCRMTDEERAAYKETIKVECGKCGKVLANKFKLVRHIQAAHSKDRLLLCKFCDHKDNRSDNMKTHIKNNHMNSKE